MTAPKWKPDVITESKLAILVNPFSPCTIWGPVGRALKLNFKLLFVGHCSEGLPHIELFRLSALNASSNYDNLSLSTSRLLIEAKYLFDQVHRTQDILLLLPLSCWWWSTINQYFLIIFLFTFPFFPFFRSPKISWSLISILIILLVTSSWWDGKKERLFLSFSCNWFWFTCIYRVKFDWF